MRKHLLFILVAAVMATFSIPANGQGFLNKLKKSVSDVTKTPEQNKNEEKEAKKGELIKVETSNFAIPRITPQTKVIKMPNVSFGNHYSDGMMYIQSGSKHGFIDTEGNVVIEMKYNIRSIGNPEFNGGYCLVSRMIDNKNRFIIIDKHGAETILPATYYNVSDFNDGKAIVYDSSAGKTTAFFINTLGKRILPTLVRSPKYSINDPEKPSTMVDGLAAFYDVALDGWGFYDAQGKVIITPQYSKIQDFSEGLAAVEKDQNWVYINQAGKVIIDTQSKYTPSAFSEGFAVSRNEKGDRIVINKEGTVVNTNFEKITPFANGIAFGRLKTGSGGMVVVDKMFNIIKTYPKALPFPSKDNYDVAVFVNGLTVLGTGQDYNEIRSSDAFNDRGEIVVSTGPTIIGKFGNFHDNRAYCYALLAKGEKYKTGFINTNGEFIFVIEE